MAHLLSSRVLALVLLAGLALAVGVATALPTDEVVIAMGGVVDPNGLA
jgi:hypothetical protein